MVTTRFPAYFCFRRDSCKEGLLHVVASTAQPCVWESAAGSFMPAVAAVEAKQSTERTLLIAYIFNVYSTIYLAYFLQEILYSYQKCTAD